MPHCGLARLPAADEEPRPAAEVRLPEDHPIHVVCEWIGNSRPVALKHYLRVTENDFEKAGGNQRAAQSGAVAADPVQHTAEELSMAGQTDEKAPTNRGVTLAHAADCGPVRKVAVTPTGLESHSISPDGSRSLAKSPLACAAESGAEGVQNDQDLALVTRVWSALRDDARACILQIERAAIEAAGDAQ